MVLYPTEQWLAEYKRNLNENEQLDEAGAGWGVDFNGDFVFQIEDIPLAETTMGDLPAEALDGIPEQLQDQLSDIPLDQAASLISDDIREHLPEKSRDLIRQLDDHIVDETVYAFIGLKDGGCTEVDILGGPQERETGFVLRGTHETWRRIVDGDLGPIPAVMSGDLEVDGDMQRILQYSDATKLLGDIAAESDTTHMF